MRLQLRACGFGRGKDRQLWPAAQAIATEDHDAAYGLAAFIQQFECRRAGHTAHHEIE
jgi:ribosomal protein L37E